ncbi:MAG: hypothetical protein JWM57_2799 [Phycisphaerales bacterium]|nr:hypothetical protein [Phycisphaerales bacterium]
MFEDSENEADGPGADPAKRAIEKSNELRLHAELAAVFEGCRKFEADIKPGLDPDMARQIQRAMAKADKSRADNNPILPESALTDARTVLAAEAFGLTTNDYHVHRRPGEVMMVRWLAGEQVDTFYERLQAHFDAGLNGMREEQRANNEWKQDESTLKYLEALDAIDVKLADRYLRQPIRDHDLVVLSTQTADEINISYLVDHVMGAEVADVVGRRAAPGDEPSESDLAWFFKLFLMRGMDDGVEAMCFFTFLQKTNDEFDEDDDDSESDD